MVAIGLGLFEQPLDDGMMPGPIEWKGQIVENLRAGPGTGIFFPAVYNCGQLLGRRHPAQQIDEPIVLRGEAFVDQDARDLVVSGTVAHVPAQ
jgi:hypothetical protein